MFDIAFMSEDDYAMIRICEAKCPLQVLAAVWKDMVDIHFAFFLSCWAEH